MSGNYVAQVRQGVVVQVIISDYEWATANLEGEWHDLGGDPLTVGIGYTYDALNDVFVETVIEEAAVVEPVIEDAPN